MSEVDSQSETHSSRPPLRFAYGCVFLFYVLYFLRPEDFVGVRLPITKIVGGLAALAIVVALLQRPQRISRLPLGATLTLVLFLDLLLTIPFAFWPGGSFDVVVNGFSKIAAIVLASAMTVTTLPRLKWLLMVQSIHAPVLALLSIAGNHRVDGRLKGFGHNFDNPNDFALVLVIGIALALGWALESRKLLAKCLWLAAVAMMSYAVLLTYSRMGFLALIITLTVAAWLLGVRCRRPALLAALGMVFLVFVVMSPQQLGHRLATIVNPSADETGSAQERQILLETSINVALHNPILGVGPGNFVILSGRWRVAHNTFAQLASEAGFPGLALFLALLLLAARSAKRARSNPELAIWSGAVRAALAAMTVGCFFGSFPYNFLPYLLFCYATALGQVAMPRPVALNSAGEMEQTDEAVAANTLQEPDSCRVSMVQDDTPPNVTLS